MKRIITGLIGLVLSVCALQNAGAQEFNCISQYQAARTFYAAGRLDTTIALLESCFDHPKSFRQVSWGNRAEIYRLAALSYFLDYQPEKARLYVKELVELDPEYHKNFREDDISEFKTEVNSLNVIPALNIGIHAGANLSFVNVLNEYFYIIEPHESREKIYSGSWGSQVGLTVEYSFLPKLTMAFNTGLQRVNFEFESEYGLDQDLLQYAYYQRMSYFYNQLCAKYNIISDPSKRLHPYILGGIYYSYLVDANRKLADDDSFTDPVKEIMRSDDLGFLAGGGVTLVTNLAGLEAYVSLDITYTASMVNVNNPDARYDYQYVNDYVFENYNVMDDITFRDILISLRWTLPISYKAFKK